MKPHLSLSLSFAIAFFVGLSPSQSFAEIDQGLCPGINTTLEEQCEYDRFQGDRCLEWGVNAGLCLVPICRVTLAIAGVYYCGSSCPTGHCPEPQPTPPPQNDPCQAYQDYLNACDGIRQLYGSGPNGPHATFPVSPDVQQGIDACQNADYEQVAEDLDRCRADHPIGD